MKFKGIARKMMIVTASLLVISSGKAVAAQEIDVTSDNQAEVLVDEGEVINEEDESMADPEPMVDDNIDDLDTDALLEELPLNGEWVSGELGTNTNKYYKLTSTEAGWISITAQNLGKIDNENKGFYILYLSDENSSVNYVNCHYVHGTTAAPETENKRSLLEPGVYILRLNTSYSTAKYRIKAEFTSAGSNDIEPNNSFETAMPISSGKIISGVLTGNGCGTDSIDLDFFTFSLDKKTDVNLIMVAKYNCARIVLLNEDFIEESSAHTHFSGSESDPRTLQIKKTLPAGKYYARIDREYGTDYTDLNEGRYTLKLTGGVTEKVKTYKIKYALAGGKNNEENPATYTAGDSIVLKAPQDRVGYTFDGWFSDSKKTVPAERISPEDKGNKTFYAKWTPIQYTITYLEADMSTVKNPATSYNITKRVSLKTPKKDGYKFKNWVNGDDQIVKSIKKGTTGDVVVTAVWTPITYKINYNLKGGKLDKDAIKQYNIETSVELPIPTRKDYAFEGWYPDSKYTGEAVTKIDIGNYGRKKFYAKWTKL